MNMKDCVFCELNKSEYLFENDLAFAVKDKVPAAKGHCLVIPKRHVRTYFELTSEEIKLMYELSIKVKEYLDNLYHPDGYNVGFNVEVSGGQSVWHAHMHILPRFKDDVAHPRGGIRKLTKI